MTHPGGERPTPAGALSGNLDWLRDVDEEFVRQRARGDLQGALGHLRSGLKDGFLAGVADALRGVVRPGFEAVADAFRDGQLALNNRVDLLSPLVDYGSAYMETTGGFLQFGNNYGPMVFNRQIGPMRNCELRDGGILLKDAGLWDVHAQLTFGGNVLNVGSGRVDWTIRVYRPDGSQFSEQRGREWNTRLVSSLIISSVVVPAPGYLVKVEIDWIHGSRELPGGPANTRLRVQHISRRTDVGGTGAEDSYIPEVPPEEEEVEP